MINKDYLYTDIYNNVSDIEIRENSTYIYAVDNEIRSRLCEKLSDTQKKNIHFIEIALIDDYRIKINGSEGRAYSLWDDQEINDLFSLCREDTVYLDVSGMNNRISASFIRYFRDNNEKELIIIYVEPRYYSLELFKKAGIHNDLSESIEGINPLPGLASIISDDESDVLFIPILGFEGGRFTYLLEQISEPNMEIMPIVGVPGYRIEYPFDSIWGNRRPLLDTQAWRNIRYSAANSITDIFFILDNIYKHNKNRIIKVAPIGTKPHAIGAILFAFMHQDNVELIYDNPIRKIGRTEGIGRIVICNVTRLISENKR